VVDFKASHLPVLVAAIFPFLQGNRPEAGLGCEGERARVKDDHFAQRSGLAPTRRALV